MLSEEIKQLEEYTYNVYNYFNGRVNYNFKAINCKIEWCRTPERNTLGLCLNGVITIYLMNILADAYNHPPYTKYEILETVIHELSHIDQCMLNMQCKYSQKEMEMMNEENTAQFILHNLDEICDVFRFNDIKKHIINRCNNAINRVYIDHCYSKATYTELVWQWLLMEFPESVKIEDMYSIFKTAMSNPYSFVEIIYTIKDTVTTDFFILKDKSYLAPMNEYLEWLYNIVSVYNYSRGAHINFATEDPNRCVVIITADMYKSMCAIATKEDKEDD